MRAYRYGENKRNIIKQATAIGGIIIVAETVALSTHPDGGKDGGAWRQSCLSTMSSDNDCHKVFPVSTTNATCLPKVSHPLSTEAAVHHTSSEKLAYSVPIVKCTAPSVGRKVWLERRLRPCGSRAENVSEEVPVKKSPAAKKSASQKRKPTEYNKFMQKKLKDKKFHPNETHRERFAAAAHAWVKSKSKA